MTQTNPGTAPMIDAKSVNWHLAILVVVVVGAAGPFIDQPFHMDDNFYMDMARNVPAKPAFPNDLAYVFEGRRLPDMGSHSHPPSQTYFLALLQSLWGEGDGVEWVYHTFALAFPLLAVGSMYFLSARFVQRPLWPALAMAVSPLFLVMQHNLMTDVATLSYWLAAITSFLWAVERRSRLLFFVSALFHLAALWTSYPSFILTLLLGWYCVRAGKIREGWWSLAAPPLAMFSWLLMTSLHYDRFILWDTIGYLESRDFGSLSSVGVKLLAVMQYQGWLIVFPLFMMITLSWYFRGRLLALGLLASAYLCQFLVADYSILEKAIFTVGLVSGAIAVFSMAHGALAGWRAPMESPAGKARDRGKEEWLFVSVWYLMVFASCLLVFTDGSARYTLPLVPPVLIGLFARLEAREVAAYRLAGRGRTVFRIFPVTFPRMSPAMMAAGILVTNLALGLALSFADLEFARVYPRMARAIRAELPIDRAYYGGEWGFRYYMGRSGMRQLPIDESSVRGGDYIVTPSLALPYEVPTALETMLSPAKSWTFGLSNPLRLIDGRSHAGFYSTGWGLLPFSLSWHPIETAQARQVNFLIAGLPWADANPVARKPWSGYTTADGKNRLALFLSPGTWLQYPLPCSKIDQLELRFRVLGDDPQSAGNGFVFTVQQEHAGGTASEYRSEVGTGDPVTHDWQLVQLSLPACGGERKITISYEATGEQELAIIEPHLK